MKNKLLIVCILIACLANVSRVSAEILPQQCTRECVENFGVEVGESFSGVTAYSNCQNNCVNPVPHFVEKVYTGIKWQCVEYARRWLLVNAGVVYGDVDIAADIWDLNYVYTPDKEKYFDFPGYVNGSGQTPQRGDLLIYARPFYGTGHVAVVLQVDLDRQRVFVGEQNFDNRKWRYKYAREISYVLRENEVWLLDPYIIGWKRVNRATSRANS